MKPICRQKRTRKKSKKDKKKMTRAERRKKRREDRERRRKERAEKRANNKKSNNGESAISIVFWATMNFFYSCIRPWVWPWWLLITLLLICLGICGYGAFSVYREMKQSQYRRVPRYNSWSYKAASMFRKKTPKQRV